MTDLGERHFLVTGANTGIGKETARALAKRGARVTMAGRSEEKTRAAMADIAAETPTADLDFLRLDLSDFESVRKAASEFLARDEPLHVLINNAGLAGTRGMTTSGFEMAFGTNHMGPFLFTQLLLDRLKQADAARIVNVASTMHYQAKGIDWDAIRQPTVSRVGMKE
jgi:dehydrogenase/reductase SDR family protein 13